MGDQFLHRYWEYLARLWKKDREDEKMAIPGEERREILRFQFSIRRAVHMLQSEDYDEDLAWQNINKRIRKGHALGRIGVVRYAAIIALAGGCGLLAWHFTPMNAPLFADQQELPREDYSGRIELILANGEKVLPEQMAGNKIFQGEIEVNVDTTEKSLKYYSRASQDTVVCYNTLKIPKGAEYMLKMADGTIVRLNSESSLRFPLNFSGHRRDVFLEGEAFFMVAKDTAAPFHVHSGTTDITVLGTEFNVSAYPGDAFWHTTLVKGSVRVDNGPDGTILRPDQQYLMDRRTGESKVQKVETGLYTSWIDGIIAFKGERLESIVRKLQRWYSFELFYQSEELKDMKFGGMINKNNSFEVVLRKLERTTNIRFEIKGHTVIAKKIQY